MRIEDIQWQSNRDSICEVEPLSVDISGGAGKYRYQMAVQQ
ncbi:MAG: hypothetical protein R2828_04525 [Saprospiraceae bacterium]